MKVCPLSMVASKDGMILNCPMVDCQLWDYKRAQCSIKTYLTEEVDIEYQHGLGKDNRDVV